jgi:hypothetical protein
MKGTFIYLLLFSLIVIAVSEMIGFSKHRDWSPIDQSVTAIICDFNYNGVCVFDFS